MDQRWWFAASRSSQTSHPYLPASTPSPHSTPSSISSSDACQGSALFCIQFQLAVHNKNFIPMPVLSTWEIESFMPLAFYIVLWPYGKGSTVVQKKETCYRNWALDLQGEAFIHQNYPSLRKKKKRNCVWNCVWVICAKSRISRLKNYVIQRIRQSFGLRKSQG